MSWDLYVQDWGEYDSLDDIPSDFVPKSIGKRTQLISRIQEIEPTVNFQNPNWGILENEQFSIEFNMGESEVSDGFVMHVRGNELAVPCIAAILDGLDLRATDGSNALFFDIKSGMSQLQSWIEYRNRIPK